MPLCGVLPSLLRLQNLLAVFQESRKSRVGVFVRAVHQFFRSGADVVAVCGVVGDTEIYHTY